MSTKTILFTVAVLVVLVYGTAITMMPTPKMKGDEKFCRTMEAAMKDQCAIEYEERVYMGGDFNYSREDRIKDIPLCDRMSSRLYYACKSGEYDKETRSP